MPYAFVIELYPLGSNQAVSVESLPRYSHGFFFKLLHEIDPNLATVVHGAPRKPFTLCSWIREHGCLQLRAALLNDTLFHPLVQKLVEQSKAGVRIGLDEYEVARVWATPESHRRAGFSTWQSLWDGPVSKTITFDFVTPTVFSTAKPSGRSRFTPLPEPSLVFRSLLSSWETHCPNASSVIDLPNVAELIEWDVVVSGMSSVRTRSYSTGKASHDGFVGSVSFRILSQDDGFIELLCMLARYAFYAGVGAKTTMGMGQVCTQLL